MSCVKLAIRIRPFTERELKSDRDRVRVVDVADDHTVTITNTKVSVSGAGDSRERVRRYNADYTFDSAGSHSLPSYATQEKVFQIIGGEVMSSISKGCSACVLAYGQSATGKTFTMFGTDAQPGLVPRLCRAFADQQPLIVTVRDQVVKFNISFNHPNKLIRESSIYTPFDRAKWRRPRSVLTDPDDEISLAIRRKIEFEKQLKHSTRPTYRPRRRGPRRAPRIPDPSTGPRADVNI